MYFIIIIIVIIIIITTTTTTTTIIVIIIIIIIMFIIVIIVVYVYVSYTCTDLVEKRVRFLQDLSLVLYLYFRIFYFCIVQLWVLVSLKYREKSLMG